MRNELKVLLGQKDAMKEDTASIRDITKISVAVKVGRLHHNVDGMVHLLEHCMSRRILSHLESIRVEFSAATYGEHTIYTIKVSTVYFHLALNAIREAFKPAIIPLDIIEQEIESIEQEYFSVSHLLRTRMSNATKLLLFSIPLLYHDGNGRKDVLAKVPNIMSKLLLLQYNNFVGQRMNITVKSSLGLHEMENCIVSMFNDLPKGQPQLPISFHVRTSAEEALIMYMHGLLGRIMALNWHITCDDFTDCWNILDYVEFAIKRELEWYFNAGAIPPIQDVYFRPLHGNDFLLVVQIYISNSVLSKSNNVILTIVNIIRNINFRQTAELRLWSQEILGKNSKNICQSLSLFGFKMAPVLSYQRAIVSPQIETVAHTLSNYLFRSFPGIIFFLKREDYLNENCFNEVNGYVYCFCKIASLTSDNNLTLPRLFPLMKSFGLKVAYPASLAFRPKVYLLLKLIGKYAQSLGMKMVCNMKKKYHQIPTSEGIMTIDVKIALLDSSISAESLQEFSRAFTPAGLAKLEGNLNTTIMQKTLQSSNAFLCSRTALEICAKWMRIILTMRELHLLCDPHPSTITVDELAPMFSDLSVHLDYAVNMSSTLLSSFFSINASKKETKYLFHHREGRSAFTTYYIPPVMPKGIIDENVIVSAYYVGQLPPKLGPLVCNFIHNVFFLHMRQINRVSYSPTVIWQPSAAAIAFFIHGQQSLAYYDALIEKFLATVDFASSISDLKLESSIQFYEEVSENDIEEVRIWLGEIQGRLRKSYITRRKFVMHLWREKDETKRTDSIQKLCQEGHIVYTSIKQIVSALVIP